MTTKIIKISAASALLGTSVAAFAASDCCGSLAACCLNLLACCL